MAEPLHGYITVQDLRDALRDQMTAFDGEYERAIAAASRQVDNYCGRVFWRESAPVARLFRPDQLDLVYIGDIATTSGLIVETDEDYDGVFETTLTVDTDFILEPFDRMNGRPYERIAAVGTTKFPVDTRPRWQRSRRPPVRVTAAWGWPAVPDEVKGACVILAVDHFKAKDLSHIASTYGGEVRIRDQPSGAFGRKVMFSRLRAPSINPEAESLIASLRVTVVA